MKIATILLALLAVGQIQAMQPKELAVKGKTELESQFLKAAFAGDDAEIKTLLDKGVNIDVESAKGETPLTTALLEKHPKTAALLIEQGANVNFANARGNTPLILAADYGYLELVKALLKRGAHLDAVNKFGETALSYAVDHEHWNVVHELLINGADPNLRNEKTGYTAFLRALLKADIPQLNEFLKYHANINQASSRGQTPLIIYILTKMYDKAKVLIDHGANVNIKDDTGNTALTYLAQQIGHNQERLELAKKLLARGADPDATDEYWQTALMFAVQRNDADMVRELREYGANRGMVNKFGKNVFFIAERNGNKKIIDALLHEPNFARIEKAQKKNDAMVQVIPKKKKEVSTMRFRGPISEETPTCPPAPAGKLKYE